MGRRMQPCEQSSRLTAGTQGKLGKRAEEARGISHELDRHQIFRLCNLSSHLSNGSPPTGWIQHVRIARGQRNCSFFVHQHTRTTANHRQVAQQCVRVFACRFARSLEPGCPTTRAGWHWWHLCRFPFGPPILAWWVRCLRFRCRLRALESSRAGGALSIHGVVVGSSGRRLLRVRPLSPSPPRPQCRPPRAGAHASSRILIASSLPDTRG